MSDVNKTIVKDDAKSYTQTEDKDGPKCGDVSMDQKWNLVKKTAFSMNIGPKRMKFNFLNGSISEDNII